MTDRRDFLRSVAAVTGAGGLAALLPARRAFARELERLGEPAGSFAALHREYMLDPHVTYLNHASIGTIPRAVHTARARLLELCETNPWLYMWGPAWQEPREEVRAKAAHFMGCGPDEMVFTHNTTEGFNLLAQGLPLGPGDEVLFSSLNHDGASVCWHHHGARRGYRVERFEFPVLDVPGLTADDVVDLYERRITPATRVLVFPHIDNMVGLRHPVRALAERARSRGVEYVAVDGAQSVGMIPVDMDAYGVDFYATSPHKWLQAPKGLGLLYVRRAVRESLSPMWVTWGQERWTESARIFEDYGTRNLPEVITLGHALDFQARLGEAAKERRYRELFETFRDRTTASARLVWRSPRRWELGASLVAIEVPGMRSGALFQRLFEEDGFVFRAFDDGTLNTVRISPNVYATDHEIDRFFAAI